MNKFLVVLLLIGSCLNIKLREVPVDDIYAAVVAIFKGMAETEEATCAGVLVNQKEKILEIVYATIDEVKAGTELSVALQNAVIKLMAVDGLVRVVAHLLRRIHVCLRLKRFQSVVALNQIVNGCHPIACLRIDFFAVNAD